MILLSKKNFVVYHLTVCCVHSLNWELVLIIVVSLNCLLTPIGTDVREYLSLNDSCIEVDLTANRADCLGMLGLAREIAVLNRCELKNQRNQTRYQPWLTFTQLMCRQPLIAPRYLGRVLRGLNVKSRNPLWMQERLRRCGLRFHRPDR